MLPLDNLSPNPDDAYFSAGIHEEIITRLAKINDLNVIARTSVMQYAAAARPISEIAAELRVGAIMEGSVRYAGDKVRVTGQLIDASDGTHLWTEVYDRDLEDIFAIQTDIATRIADALKAELAPSERESIGKAPTNSPEGLCALPACDGGTPATRSRDSVVSAKYAQDAIASLDEAQSRSIPTSRSRMCKEVESTCPFAQSRSWLGGESTRARRNEVETAAIEDLEKALALDPSIGLAQAALARVHQLNWRGHEAREGYDHALELSPSDPEVLIDAAVFFAFAGDIDEGKRLGRRALELDPNNGPRHAMNAMLYQLSGDFDAAATGQQRAAALSPMAIIPRTWLGHVERLRGNTTEALEHTRKAEKLLQNIATITLYAELVYLYGILGQLDDAKRVLRKIREFSKTRRIPIAAWVLSDLGLGDYDRALEWLTVAADDPQPYEGYFGLMSVVLNYLHHPVLEEPRFKAVRDRMGYRN